MSCYPVLNFNKPLLALVLCGGESKRMGTDKGLLKKSNNNTWVEHILHNCYELHLEAYVSINKSQVKTYSNIINTEICIVDTYENLGPLGGLLSFHNQFPEHDALILSCDMQDVTAEILNKFLIQNDQLSYFDALLPANEKFYQPFPGLYSSEMLSKLSQLHLLNQIKTYSFQWLLPLFSVNYIDLTAHEQLQLKSYNDLQA